MGLCVLLQLSTLMRARYIYIFKPDYTGTQTHTQNDSNIISDVLFIHKTSQFVPSHRYHQSIGFWEILAWREKKKQTKTKPRHMHTWGHINACHFLSYFISLSITSGFGHIKQVTCTVVKRAIFIWHQTSAGSLDHFFKYSTSFSNSRRDEKLYFA